MEIERKFLVPCLPEAMTPIPSTRLNRPISALTGSPHPPGG